MFKKTKKITAEVCLKREYMGEDCTLGTLYIDRKEFCKTLELPWRDNKRSISCIPAGQYNVKRHNSPRFGDCFMLLDVPERDYILFHEGNTVRSSRGCILVGAKFGHIRGMKAVLNSVKTNNKMLEYFHDDAEFILHIVN